MLGVKGERVMTEWLVAVSSLISASAVIAIWWQARLTRTILIQATKQNSILQETLTASAEQSRRDQAVNLLLQWSQLLTKKMSCARAVAEGLDREQAENIWRGKEARLPTKMENNVVANLQEIGGRSAPGLTIGEDISLTAESLIELRWNIVCYLNLLESVFLARRHNVADTKMIDEQFTHLVSSAEGKDVLRNIRIAMGGSTVLPGIEEFAREKELEQNALPPGKSQIV